jgi:hypothetical protein
MLITIGKEWVSETSPGEVKEAISKSKRKEQGYLNVLHTVDFIHLGDFLFMPYPTKPKEELYERLKTATAEQLQELKEYVPQSNWQRYFASLVACEDSYLSSRWKDLYELRCKVAHNALLTRVDFDEIQRLVGEIKPKLDDANRKLDQVSVPRDEAETVAERASGINRFATGIENYTSSTPFLLRGKLSRALASAYRRYFDERQRNAKDDLARLVDAGAVPLDFVGTFHELRSSLDDRAKRGIEDDESLRPLRVEVERMTKVLNDVPSKAKVDEEQN